MTEKQHHPSEQHDHHQMQAMMDHDGAHEEHHAQQVPLHGSAHGAHSADMHHDHSAHTSGNGGHAGHSEAMFQRPFWISLILTIPVLIYAELFQELLGYTAPQFPGAAYVGFVLGSIIYWYGGWVFLRGAVDEVRARTPGMMTLVALAISTAYFYSVAVTLGLVAGMPFYWELATLVTIMLLGHWMEMRAVGSAQSALNELAKLLPDTAERIVNGGTETVPVAALRADDLVLVRPGTRIPADGVVVEGDSQLNEAMITGESRPVHKRPDDEVIAGTVNGSGSLRVRVTKTGEQTALAGIMRLVAEAQNSRSRAQALADRAAYWLTFVALGVAILTLIAWVLARGFDSYTLERVVTVLVVACPHALGLAIPLVIAISTTLSARNGILVRDRLALEEARTVTTVVFDKTGTLTKGEQGLVGMATNGRVSEDAALAQAAAIEGDSEHIIARAIVAAAQQRNLSLPTVSDFTSLPGRGVQARVAGHTVQVGGPRLLEQGNVQLSDELAQQTRAWGARGQTVVYLLEAGTVQAAFALADVIRPESHEAVQTLQAQGVEVAMLTGDSDDVARWVAGELSIRTYFAQVLPEHKAAKVKELQQHGAKVAMVGDGVNDAPALAQADVGIAIGAGTDVARAAAGIVLVRNDPRDIARIIRLSRASYRKMIQNLAWAIGYNAIALPLAAGVLAGVGFVLPAWVGAVLMSLSTIIVAMNAQLLRRLDLQDRPAEHTEITPQLAS
ncbi:MAG TPA: heavy metal translocating P-type ATPase [Roseiflexaceae bacterium]|nr:heavy metal translocating P-type ATPase [Roseiflexaceae bacterium]